MQRVKLGGPTGLEVSKCGMGVMSITAFYGDPIPDKDAIELLQKAVESGCTFFDTAEAYVAEHPVTKELLWNEEILGKAVATIGRDKVQIGTKFGGKSAATGPARGDHMKKACHAALKRLQTDTIDLYYLHRVDPDVPIEETVETMADLVREGAVRHIGLSEASPEVIRRAHAVHPVSAVQQEWSLYTRDLEEDIVPVCKALGIGIVPYSPLGRGFLSDDMVAPANDARQMFPRLTGEAFEANKALRAKVEAMAKDKGCHTAQLALAWLWAQGEKIGVDVVPIPGTTKIKNMQSNCRAVDVSISDSELAELSSAFDSVVGERGFAQYMDGTYRVRTNARPAQD
jgi:aryl-alcohol dehydrogenase-like predicted oxidoreductase